MSELESLFGIDIGFDLPTGKAATQGTKDVIANVEDTDYKYVKGIVALSEELQRLFDLTPKGSFIDDPTYGIDWEFIGSPADPRAMCGITKVAVYQALNHPSFRERFRVKALDVRWKPETPNVLYVRGVTISLWCGSCSVWGIRLTQLISRLPALPPCVALMESASSYGVR
ncbi:MAG: hypothetical protein LRZ84_14500 [Desertifilum sp.]|nr:hypothetical protein [Desertifilum sp.]